MFTYIIENYNGVLQLFFFLSEDLHYLTQAGLRLAM
jgi:hypothetical protein